MEKVDTASSDTAAKSQSQDKKQLNLREDFHIQLFDETGKLIKEDRGTNGITSAGLTLLAQIIADDGAPVLPSHIAIGTSATAFSAAQTALQGTELDRNALSVSRATAVLTYEATFAAGEGTGTIEEAGVFNAGAAGTMLSRFLTGTYTKGASNSLVIRWQLTVA